MSRKVNSRSTKASEQKKPVIFVTDDSKDDWWWKSRGKTLGAASELVEEMQRKAQVRIHFYTTERFMEFAKEYLQSEIKNNAIEEVRDVREAALLQSRQRQIMPTLEEQEFEKKFRQMSEVLQQQNTLLPYDEVQRQLANLMRPNAEARRLLQQFSGAEKTDYTDEPDEADSSEEKD